MPACTSSALIAPTFFNTELARTEKSAQLKIPSQPFSPSQCKHGTDTEQMAESSWLRCGTMYIHSSHKRKLVMLSAERPLPAALNNDTITLRFRGWRDTVTLSSVLVTWLTLPSSLSGRKRLSARTEAELDRCCFCYQVILVLTAGWFLYWSIIVQERYFLPQSSRTLWWGLGEFEFSAHGERAKSYNLCHHR